MVRVTDLERFVFVVGAPRCGTTTLSHFFKTHPSIRFPAVKEPHYFAQNDLRGLSDEELRARVEREYLDRYFRAGEGRAVGADCSVTYLYAPEQLEPILRLWPNSRFIIAFRDPLTMLPSLHRRLVFMGDENLSTFAKAWGAVPDRAKGRKIPARCLEPRWLRYDEAAKFGTYLERLFEVVGRERCHPVVFDDLSSDPSGEYRKLMEFCDLQPVADMELARQRPGKAVRYPWLQRLLKRPPIIMSRHLAADKYLSRSRDADESEPKQSGVMSLRKRLLRWNRIEAPAERLPMSLQLELREELKGEIDHLGELIGRDLSNWLVPREAPLPGSPPVANAQAARRPVSNRRIA